MIVCMLVFRAYLRLFVDCFFFNDTATTEIYTYLTHSFPTRRSSDLLRLMPKAPEADGMNDAIAVALKCVAGTARATARLSMLTAAALFRQAGVGRMRAHFSVSFSTSSPSVLCQT